MQRRVAPGDCRRTTHHEPTTPRLSKPSQLPQPAHGLTVGISCGRARRPGGPARRVLRRRRDGSGRQLVGSGSGA
jgi:hypothetical protein